MIKNQVFESSIALTLTVELNGKIIVAKERKNFFYILNLIFVKRYGNFEGINTEKINITHSPKIKLNCYNRQPLQNSAKKDFLNNKFIENCKNPNLLLHINKTTSKIGLHLFNQQASLIKTKKSTQTRSESQLNGSFKNLFWHSDERAGKIKNNEDIKFEVADLEAINYSCFHLN
ncbi:hypothetical protein BpHYR1_008431 [Brachionus plicatilis]|uniref:Uncharacterized protein n=1 Tax=Brachionus plicatilis TaxID=10195 RepID=A0A3M7SBM3_BRAPC|nr:hypothetical protein BpHYR1_008431 [Brachionus plicatilis]